MLGVWLKNNAEKFRVRHSISHQAQVLADKLAVLICLTVEIDFLTTHIIVRPKSKYEARRHHCRSTFVVPTLYIKVAK